MPPTKKKASKPRKPTQKQKQKQNVSQRVSVRVVTAGGRRARGGSSGGSGGQPGGGAAALLAHQHAPMMADLEARSRMAERMQNVPRDTPVNVVTSRPAAREESINAGSPVVTPRLDPIKSSEATSVYRRSRSEPGSGSMNQAPVAQRGLRGRPILGRPDFAVVDDAIDAMMGAVGGLTVERANKILAVLHEKDE